jgi:D-beta-D-heptose 7-phosphate kinase/D-beta-D-heptose 1-phosphate adenosyltransferase
MHDSKILTLGPLTRWREHWRRLGLTIGFTNGCFDRFHLGHLTLLYHARRECDRLIAAVNSDASVRALKGEGRPRNPAELRASACLMAGADRAIIFEEATPVALVAALRPDVLLKGGDYAGREVVGAEIVRARGGRLVLVPHCHGVSTSALLEEEEDARATTQSHGAPGDAPAPPDRQEQKGL